MTRAPHAATAGLVAAALQAASPAALAHDGEKLYQRHCVQCHSVARITETLRAIGPADAVRQRLEALLPRHHAADADDRDAIVAYLLTLHRG